MAPRECAIVDALIFSKDRPAQLDLLLRSIDRYALGLYASLTVLAASSAPEYRDGYRRVFADRPGVQVWPETRFESQVKLWVLSKARPVSFLCDDDVFYRSAFNPGVLQPGRLPLSFRGGDYDYPFSLDGVVYESRDLRPLLEGLHFTGPTSLEHAGHLARERLPFATLNESPACLTGWPLNRVSAESSMPSLGVHEYDLNERFLEGRRLAIPAVPASSGPLPPHVTNELELVWE